MSKIFFVDDSDSLQHRERLEGCDSNIRRCEVMDRCFEYSITDPWDWYIYLHLVDFYGKCRYIYHTYPYMDPVCMDIFRLNFAELHHLKHLQVAGKTESRSEFFLLQSLNLESYG